MYDEQTIYLTNDERLRCIAPASTFRRWRSEGNGPAFVRISSARVGYAGKALNDWLESRTVRPGSETESA